MLKSFRNGAAVVLLLCSTISSGVAAADPPNPEDATDCFYKASPNPGKLDDVSDCKETADGNWRLHIYLHNASITSVPNMAATAFTRQAYVSATAIVWVQALHPDDPTPPGAGVLQRSLTLFLEMGCQAVLQGNTLSLNNATPTGGLSATTSNTGTTSVTPNVAVSPNPTDLQQLSPGTITTKSLMLKAWPPTLPDPYAAPPAHPPPGWPTPTPPWVTDGWQGDTLTVTVQNWNEKVDGCGGPVSFRFLGGATIYTPRYNADIAAYSDIVQV